LGFGERERRRGFERQLGVGVARNTKKKKNATARVFLFLLLEEKARPNATSGPSKL
jgi:hypothetical protein